jgi:hypothetical protein
VGVRGLYRTRLVSITAQAAGPDAGDGPGSATLAIPSLKEINTMLISSQARLSLIVRPDNEGKYA